MAGNFNISYIFTAKDKLSNVGNKIKKSLNGVAVSAKKLPPSIKAIPKAFISAGRSIKASLKKMGAGIVALGKKFKKTKKSIQKDSQGLGSSIKNLAGAFLGFQAAKGFVQVGADFETALADVKAIANPTAEALKFISDESLRLAKVSVRSQDQVATAFKLVASAKSELLKDPKALTTVTEQVLLLANAAKIDLSTATLAAVGALNQFGVGAEEANRFVNVLAASQAVGASEVGELTEALKVSGKIASLTGLSFEQTNAALQVLAKSNIKGSEAGTGLKNVLVKMDVVLKKLGPSTIGLAKSLEIIKAANLSTEQATTKFGAEAATALLTLADGIPTLKRFTREMTGTQEAQRQADAQLNTFSKRWQLLVIIIKDKVIRLFEKLKPTLNRIIERISAFFDKIKQEDIDKFANNVKTLIGVFVDKLEPTLLKVGELVQNLFASENLGGAKEFLTSMKNIAKFVGTIAEGFNIIFKGLKIVGKFIGEEAAITALAFSGDFKALKAVQDADKLAKKIAETPKQKPNIPKPVVKNLADSLKNAANSNVTNFPSKINSGALSAPLNNDALNQSNANQQFQGTMDIKVSTDPGVNADVKQKSKGSGMNVGLSMGGP